MRQILSLNGIWKGWPASKGPIESKFPCHTALDTANWLDIRVPSHWQTQKGFGKEESVVYYWTSFATPNLAPNQSVLLELKGIFHSATIWLNGYVVGRHEGYYYPFIADVTSKLSREPENTLMIRAEWPGRVTPSSQSHKADVYGYWGMSRHEQHPGGIWRDVNLHIVDQVYICKSRVTTSLTAFDSANITLSLDCVSSVDENVSIDWTLEPGNFKGSTLKGSTIRQVHEGNNSVSVRFTLNKPRLWWPWERGEPNLYVLNVKIGSEDRIVDRISLRFGVRQVKMQDGYVFINHQRVFLRGTNYGPPDIHLGKVTRQDLEKDVQLMLEANLNCVRLYRHVCPDEFYSICDENGLMVWQDSPVDYQYNREVEIEIVEQTKRMITSLHSHPAIIVWGLSSSSNQAGRLYQQLQKLFAYWYRKSRRSQVEHNLTTEDASRVVIINYLFCDLISCWNPSEKEVWPWDTGGRLGRRLRSFFRKNRIVTAYGALAFPGTATMSRMGFTADATQLDWTRLERRYFVNKRCLDRFVSSNNYEQAGTYFMATQQIQAKVLKYYHETLRRMKYRPCAGCIQYMFNDSIPGITWSIVDYWRRHKLGYIATKKAMQPIFVLSEWPQDEYYEDDGISLQIYAINDTCTVFMASAVLWEIADANGNIVSKGRMVVDLMADCIVHAGNVEWSTVTTKPLGKYALNICLELPTREKVDNSYEFSIVR